MSSMPEREHATRISPALRVDELHLELRSRSYSAQAGGPEAWAIALRNTVLRRLSERLHAEDRALFERDMSIPQVDIDLGTLSSPIDWEAVAEKICDALAHEVRSRTATPESAQEPAMEPSLRAWPRLEHTEKTTSTRQDDTPDLRLKTAQASSTDGTEAHWALQHLPVLSDTAVIHLAYALGKTTTRALWMSEMRKVTRSQALSTSVEAAAKDAQHGAAIYLLALKARLRRELIDPARLLKTARSVSQNRSANYGNLPEKAPLTDPAAGMAADAAPVGVATAYDGFAGTDKEPALPKGDAQTRISSPSSDDTPSDREDAFKEESVKSQGQFGPPTDDVAALTPKERPFGEATSVERKEAVDAPGSQRLAQEDSDTDQLEQGLAPGAAKDGKTASPEKETPTRSGDDTRHSQHVVEDGDLLTALRHASQEAVQRLAVSVGAVQARALWQRELSGQTATQTLKDAVDKAAAQSSRPEVFHLLALQSRLRGTAIDLQHIAELIASALGVPEELPPELDPRRSAIEHTSQGPEGAAKGPSEDAPSEEASITPVRPDEADHQGFDSNISAQKVADRGDDTVRSRDEDTAKETVFPPTYKGDPIPDKEHREDPSKDEVAKTDLKTGENADGATAPDPATAAPQSNQHTTHPKRAKDDAADGAARETAHPSGPVPDVTSDDANVASGHLTAGVETGSASSADDAADDAGRETAHPSGPVPDVTSDDANVASGHLTAGVETGSASSAGDAADGAAGETAHPSGPVPDVTSDDANVASGHLTAGVETGSASSAGDAADGAAGETAHPSGPVPDVTSDDANVASGHLSAGMETGSASLADDAAARRSVPSPDRHAAESASRDLQTEALREAGQLARDARTPDEQGNARPPVADDVAEPLPADAIPGGRGSTPKLPENASSQSSSDAIRDLVGALDGVSDGIPHPELAILVAKALNTNPGDLRNALAHPRLGRARIVVLVRNVSVDEAQRVFHAVAGRKDRAVAAFADQFWPLLPTDTRNLAGEEGKLIYLLEVAAGKRSAPPTMAAFVRDVVAGIPDGDRSTFVAHVTRLLHLAPSLVSPHEAKQILDVLSASPARQHADVARDRPVMGDTQAELTEVSGLVLLARFLPSYFSRLELLDAEGGLPSKHVEAAAGALLALCYGDTHAPNGIGPLGHVLLGLKTRLAGEIAAPDPKTVALADSLLEAAISHWGALGSTSPQGLRDAFIQRTGVLTNPSGEDQIRLEVEARPYDMLLDKLPWTVSPVRLRWMASPLFVSWRGMSSDG